MATASPLQVTAAHNLSQSSRAEAQGYSQLPSPPRGDVEATLNFYSPPEDGSTPFNYVETQPAGQIQRNFGDHDEQVKLHDVRGRESEYNLDKHAFQVLQNVPQSAEKEFVDDASIEKNYYPEVEKLLLNNIPGANRIFIFDHTIRRPTGSRSAVNKVHIDQSAKAARDRVFHHLPEEAEKLVQGRYRIINVWRPLNGPVYATPLTFAASYTVEDKDVVPVEHRYPDRTGQTAGVNYNPSQKWHYLSGMTNNERLFLECFDSEGLKEGSSVKGGRLPHSAFIDPRTPADAPGRESIEVRCLVFGPWDWVMRALEEVGVLWNCMTCGVDD